MCAFLANGGTDNGHAGLVNDVTCHLLAVVTFLLRRATFFGFGAFRYDNVLAFNLVRHALSYKNLVYSLLQFGCVNVNLTTGIDVVGSKHKRISTFLPQLRHGGLHAHAVKMKLNALSSYSKAHAQQKRSH